MHRPTNFFNNLPYKVKIQFQELFPSEDTPMKTFLKRTEWCQDLYEWHSDKIYRKKKFVFFLRKNQMDLSTFNILKSATFKASFKEVKLKKPVKVRGEHYSKVLLEPPQQNKEYIYIDFMKIYLEK